MNVIRKLVYSNDETRLDFWFCITRKSLDSLWHLLPLQPRGSSSARHWTGLLWFRQGVNMKLSHLDLNHDQKWKNVIVVYLGPSLEIK